jgi:hypothetical protein
MGDATIESQQWLLRITILAVLLFCVEDRLACELILDLECDDGQTIHKEDDIDGVLILLRVVKLPDYVKHILFVQVRVIRIQATVGFEIDEMKMTSPVFDTVAQHIDDAAF